MIDEPREYTKKPSVITAIQWDGTLAKAAVLDAWVRSSTADAESVEVVFRANGTPERLVVQTREGSSLDLIPGAWLIRGVKGEFYPCQDDIFRQLHNMEDN